MTNCVNKVLIIGGGFSGMSAAIELSKKNIDVDLVEKDEHWRPEGAGISIGGATIRAFEQIGIFEEFMKFGHGHTGVEVYLPHGVKLADVPTPPVENGEHLPPSGAIMRPDLANILAEKTRLSGVNVRLGVTHTSIEQQGKQAKVTFTDGTVDMYDLVIGADGLHSTVRAQFFPEAPKPQYVGQGVWRAVIPRPESIKTCTIWVSEHTKAGVNPMSKDQMYLFVTEHNENRERMNSAEYVTHLQNLLAGFPNPVLQEIKAGLSEASQIDYRPLDNMLMPLPWHNDNVVVIGDAVHATTPHLASGACIGIEDAIVLAEELSSNTDLNTALTAFGKRRYDRCAMVVNNSAELAKIEVEGGDKQRHAQIMAQSGMALAKAI